MEQNEPLQYRTKLSSALLYSSIFIVFTATIIYISLLDAEKLSISPSILFVLAFFVGLYIMQLAKSPPQNKKAQAVISLGSFFVTLFFILLFTKATLLVIGIGLFGILGAYYIWINVITRQPIVQADNQHLLLHNGFFRGRSFTVSWDNISEISTHQQVVFGGNKRNHLGVKLKNLESFLENNQRQNSKTLRRVIDSNLNMFGAHLMVDITNLETGKDKLVEELNQFLA